MKRGSVIGNIAKDLGIDMKSLSSRDARIDNEGNRKRYCDINMNTGELIVAERIDREGLCGKKASCVIKQELVLENPLELHRFILNIQDINDNSPQFKQSIIKFEISESAYKGSRYLLDEAHDADIGMNSVQSYTLQNNENFLLSVLTGANGGKYGELVINKELDREKQSEVALILTAVDGGTPPRSDTVVVTVSATDADEGQNGEVTYEFDNLAEVPELKDMSGDESSSKLTFYLIIALVSVSTFFLTFIIIILAVRFCRRRKPRLLFDGAVAIPSGYLPPNYAEVEGAGTLRSTYNYDAYLTTGSRTSDFKFVRSYNEGTLTADLTLKKTPFAVDNLEGLEAEMNDSFQTM
ncbi:protocadherin beta-15-like protein [Labeo rohita]|uniref:Protocadherin beta-15-like protein n=1 Tax=Labeo rohita TaxID=84645 RepID=A0A498MYQ1_LABRO|nr:protocadherin beta-15-like protein [Labeo rohita]